jgi:Endonuclease NucS
MSDEVRLWDASGGELKEIDRSTLDLESQIHDWIERDISILDPELLVIGKEVQTAFGKSIDLLCMDSTGNLVIVELKRNMTPREVTAQTLDYASWVKDLEREEIQDIAAEYFTKKAKRETLESAFREKFGDPLPDLINENHAMRVVAAEIDDGTERIIRYLSETYGVDINAIRFHCFKATDR